MPIATENPDAESGPVDKHEDAAPNEAAAANAVGARSRSPRKGPDPQKTAPHSHDVTPPESDAATTLEAASPGTATNNMVSKFRPQQAPFHQPRPSLAQSSFSWMLGEDQHKSSFVSPSPFPSERRAAREKAGFLFGESKNSAEGKTQKGKTIEESEDEEVINMGTLKGRSKQQKSDH